MLRREMSIPERKLWKALRNRGAEAKFRRQHPIGPYVLDFYCHEALLAVEMDGYSHTTRWQRDEARDEWLSARGIATLRVSVSDFERHPDAVLETIYVTCADRITRNQLRLRADAAREPSPQPSPLVREREGKVT